jgi:hypothetical protein
MLLMHAKQARKLTLEDFRQTEKLGLPFEQEEFSSEKSNSFKYLSGHYLRRQPIKSIQRLFQNFENNDWLNESYFISAKDFSLISATALKVLVEENILNQRNPEKELKPLVALTNRFMRELHPQERFKALNGLYPDNEFNQDNMQTLNAELAYINTNSLLDDKSVGNFFSLICWKRFGWSGSSVDFSDYAWQNRFHRLTQPTNIFPETAINLFSKDLSVAIKYMNNYFRSVVFEVILEQAAGLKDTEISEDVGESLYQSIEKRLWRERVFLNQIVVDNLYAEYFQTDQMVMPLSYEYVEKRIAAGLPVAVELELFRNSISDAADSKAQSRFAALISRSKR